MPDRPTLPARRVRLIGRVPELRLIRDRVLSADGRLVTVTGAGGVGKTTLACEAARGLGSAAAEGAVLVDLTSTDERDAVALACCESLGLVGQERSPIDVLVEHFAPRQALLVLDGCEYLLPEVGDLVDRLLDGCPDLRVLATSRVPLRRRGEEVLVVPPMPVPSGGAEGSAAIGAEELGRVPSVELFVERARAVRPDFRLTDWALAVSSICRRLDGLPLAIELAAAQVAALTPAEIDERLAPHNDAGIGRAGRAGDAGWPPGVGGSGARGRRGGGRGRDGRGASDHSGTMETTLDWSHDLLDVHEQAVFRRLSVFAGGWTLAAAEHVCSLGGDPSRVAATLVSLAESSLVLREESSHGHEGRFRMLGPVKEYAAARLAASGEQRAAGLSHAQHYLTLASPREADWRVIGPEHLDLIAAEHDNCLAALRFAEQAGIAPIVLGLDTSLMLFWRVRGLLRTGQRRLEAALTVVGDATSRERGLVLAGLAHYGQLLGELADAERRGLEAEAALQDAGDAVGLRTVLGFLGDIAADKGELSAAQELYDRARQLLGTDDSELDLGFWHANVGRLAARRGDLTSAERELERAREHFATAPGWYVAHVLVQLGNLARHRGDLDRAGALLERALGYLRAYGASVEAIACLDELARLALDRGDPGRAATLFAAATRLRDVTALATSDGERQVLALDVERARAQLTSAEFVDAWGRGRALTLEEATRVATSTAGAPRAPTQPPASSPAPAHPLATALTPREREVAALVAEGLSNARIGEELAIAHGTARIHVERILGKLGLTSRVQVATWVVRNPDALHAGGTRER